MKANLIKRWRAMRAQWFVASLRIVDSSRVRMLIAMLLFPCMPAYANKRERAAAKIFIPRGGEGDMRIVEENYYPRCASECAKPHYVHGCECQRGKNRSASFDIGGES